MTDLAMRLGRSTAIGGATQAPAAPVKVNKLAKEVRGEAERWAREKGDPADLELWCAVTSAAFVMLAMEAGIRAEIANGFFVGVTPADSHFWAFAWEDGRCYLVDLTLTQYIHEAPPAAVLDDENEMLRWYGVLDAGARAYESMCAADAADAQILARRVRAQRAEATCTP